MSLGARGVSVLFASGEIRAQTSSPKLTRRTKVTVVYLVHKVCYFPLSLPHLNSSQRKIVQPLCRHFPQLVHGKPPLEQPLTRTLKLGLTSAVAVSLTISLRPATRLQP